MKNIKDRDYLRHIDEINSIMKGSGIIFMYMGIPISMRNTKEDIMKILQQKEADRYSR